MIEFRWKKLEDPIPEGPTNLALLSGCYAVLEYRESWSEILVSTETGDKCRVQSFEGVDWRTVPLVRDE